MYYCVCLCREAWRLGGSSSVAGVRGCCIIPHFDSGAGAGAGAWKDGTVDGVNVAQLWQKGAH
jgi:hypothetical protein